MLELTVHVYHHHDHGESSEQREILRLLRQLVERSHIVSRELDALTAEVARNTTVDESAIVLLKGLADRIEELKGDPAALQALADELRAKNDALAAAVVAHTPAA